jgi:long-chain acyl-CoA synthetase
MSVPLQRVVHDSLLVAAEVRPEHTAIVDEFGRRTYGELLDEALRLARLLQDEGLGRGDRVAIYLDNTSDCAAAIFGTLLAGGVFTVVNAQTKARKLAFVLADSEAKFLLAEGHSAPIVTEALEQTPPAVRVYERRGHKGDVHGFTDLHEALGASEPSPRRPGTIPLDLATLVYTSGTTGEPKGVMLSHQALVFTVGSIAEYLRLGADDRIFSFLPLAFTYGLSQLLVSARLHATLLLERSFAFPARTLQRLRDERATVLPAVPTVFATLLAMEHPEPYTDVRCLTNAAAALPPASHEGIRRLFPNAALYRMYGLSECVRVCYLEPELVDAYPTSVGRAIPGTEAFVLDDEGQPVEPGQTGVLHVRGPHLMMGYWRDPAATSLMLKDGPFPGERILSTNDHFTIDDNDLLYFVGRRDDIIKTRGEKVSTVEIENALHAIDGIHQAAVIGVPDELLGQAIKAFVVLDADAPLTETEILLRLRAELENFMIPKEVVIVAELPHTASGKVRKRSLVEQPVAQSRGG